MDEDKTFDILRRTPITEMFYIMDKWLTPPHEYTEHEWHIKLAEHGWNDKDYYIALNTIGQVHW
jgi:hypothetical protein